METKYYRYTLDGEHSLDQAERALGAAAGQGLLVRLDTAKGKTHVYIATPSDGAGEKVAAPLGATVTEVQASDLTKFG